MVLAYFRPAAVSQWLRFKPESRADSHGNGPARIDTGFTDIDAHAFSRANSHSPPADRSADRSFHRDRRRPLHCFHSTRNFLRHVSSWIDLGPGSRPRAYYDPLVRALDYNHSAVCGQVRSEEHTSEP